MIHLHDNHGHANARPTHHDYVYVHDLPLFPHFHAHVDDYVHEDAHEYGCENVHANESRHHVGADVYEYEYAHDRGNEYAHVYVLLSLHALNYKYNILFFRFKIFGK